ncbi:MAG: TIGR02302 family protein, partial [Proteobacteria bacterium]|nr:TIGR02302 family protein [Pseudomonadota bacterium]
AFAASLWPLLRWRPPALTEAATRLDLADPTLHRPLATLGDQVVGNDPVARVIWDQHRARAEAAAKALAVAPPKSRMPSLDSFAIRGFAAVAVVAAAFSAGNERRERLADAFAWGELRTPAIPPRLDAWIDPPAYTGRAPIFLSGGNATTGPVHVPAGSIAVIRVSPADGVNVNAPLTLREKAREQETGRPVTTSASVPATTAQAPFEKRYLLDHDAVLDVRKGSASLGNFDIRTIPDMPPRIVFSEIEPEEKGAGLRLKYMLEDDYGVAKAEAIITRADKSSARTLVPPPEIVLGGRLGETESLLSVPEHPWAGARVAIRLRATDDLGQIGESDVLEATIPARRFEAPVSRALVEQRRNIALNPDNRRTPQVALDGLLVAPERFTRKSGDFIMLSMAARKLRTARTDADLVALMDYLWETAVAMDEGNLTAAERALRAAEDRLREALERGANNDEISKLMDEMRQAMNEMLRELMDRADRNADRNPGDPSQKTLNLSQRDLNDMLKRIEELYRQGDTAKAQEMLRQFQEMLNQMRSARRSADPRMKEMGEAMDELDRLQREQEALRDETFRNENRRRMGRNQQRPQQGQQGQRSQQGQKGQKGEQGQQGEQGEDGDEGEEQADNSQGLTERQQALRDRLQQLREKMRRQGQPTDEGMDGADEGMGDAEQGLRQRQGGRATQGQQKAIDELGRAGRALSQQMQREMGQGNEPGEGEGMGPGDPNRNPRGRADQSTDPLGRPLSSSRDQLDNSRGTMLNNKETERGSISERAQRVLEELRRRFGEIERPREELDYIERLLRRN